MLAEQFMKFILTNTSLLICAVLFLVVVIFVRWIINMCQLPPGPWGWPIVGSLRSAKGDTYIYYMKLAKKYGPVFSIKMGNQLINVISDYRIIRELFMRDEYSGRPHTEFNNILEGYGVVNAEGALWRDERKFISKQLRHFGIKHISNNRGKIYDAMMYELNALLHGLRATRGAPTNLSIPFGRSISNVICKIIMGERFEHGDSQFDRFNYLIDEGFKLFGQLTSSNYLPILRYLPCNRRVRNKIAQNMAEMAKFFKNIIDRERANFDENNIEHLLDAYTQEINQAKEEGRENQLFEGKDHDRQILQILGDLFSAGMETVKNTLEWSMLLMLHHPEAAKAVQDELDQVVGRSRMPTVSDRLSLPITTATILEVLRKTSVVPLGTTHATLRDEKLNGYNIPAGSQVVPFLYAIHMDPKHWGDPEVFRPSRFLTNDGRVSEPKYYMPFGFGRRVCLGKQLAEEEVFLFFSSIMHSFDLQLPEGKPMPTLRGIAGVTLFPTPFDVCLIPRELNIANSNDIPIGSLWRNVGFH